MEREQPIADLEGLDVKKTLFLSSQPVYQCEREQRVCEQVV